MSTDPLPDLPPASQRQHRSDAAQDRATAIRALTLRINGLTYQQIADELGYSDKASAHNALMRALDRHEAENVDVLRDVENYKHKADERALRAIIANPDSAPRDVIAAVNSRTRVAARVARLNGLDAPIQIEVSGEVRAAAQAMLDDLTRAVLGDDDAWDIASPPEPDAPPA